MRLLKQYSVNTRMLEKSLQHTHFVLKRFLVIQKDKILLVDFFRAPKDNFQTVRGLTFLHLSLEGK